MLKTDFVNDLRKNYMVAGYEMPEEGFALRMLTENISESFLPLEMRRLDGQKLLYYDISGMQNMEIMYGEKLLERTAFQQLMWNLHEAIEQSRELFLPGDGICLEPAMMFWDMEKQRWKFVYLPERGEQEAGEIQEEREHLAEFLVEKIDYEDKELTETVYRFYEEICAGRIYPESFLIREGRTIEEQTIKEQIIKETETAENTGNRQGKEDRNKIENTVWGEESGEKRLTFLLIVLLLLTAGVTFSMRGYGRHVVIGGGAVSIILTGMLLYRYIKRQNGREEAAADEPEGGPAGKYLFLEEMEFEPISEEGEEREYNEKTVYIDMEEEKVKKLYGMGKFHKQKISLEQLPCTIGKDSALANLIISDSSVSRMHARFFREDEKLWMQDLNSTNGTYHNGIRLKPNEKVPLEAEDEVGFGRVQFVYR